MSPTPLVIIGAGGFGREVLGMIRAQDPSGVSWDVRGFVTEVPADPAVLARLGVSTLGTDDEFLANPVAESFVAAIGHPQQRRRVVERYAAAGLQAVCIRHPSAVIGADVDLGQGTVIAGLASATTNVRLGDHVHLDRLASVGHDVVVGPFTTIHPGALISGFVTIEDEVRVGAGSLIMPSLTIGSGAIIGAGAVVTRDVPSGAVVAGVPARIRDPLGGQQ